MSHADDIESLLLDAMHAGAIDSGQTYGQIAGRLAAALVAAGVTVRPAHPPRTEDTMRDLGFLPAQPAPVAADVEALVERLAQTFADECPEGCGSASGGWVAHRDDAEAALAGVVATARAEALREAATECPVVGMQTWLKDRAAREDGAT